MFIARESDPQVPYGEKPSGVFSLGALSHRAQKPSEGIGTVHQGGREGLVLHRFAGRGAVRPCYDPLKDIGYMTGMSYCKDRPTSFGKTCLQWKVKGPVSSVPSL